MKEIKEAINAMKEAMDAIKKACQKFDSCTNCPYGEYCRYEDFPMPEKWKFEKDEN